ncbi:hypothetical protein MOUN0_C04082 [Monosporozyma unispora]
MDEEKQNLVDVIQECLKLLDEYNLLCGKIKQLSNAKDKEYYIACYEAYNCYQRCYKLIFNYIITMDKFKSLQSDKSLYLNENTPSLISVYNKLRRLLLTDTQIETIKFEYYNYNVITNYMNKLVANSWISMSVINNILNQRDKLTLIIEVDDHMEDPGRREIIPCRNYVRLPTSLIKEGESIKQLEFNVQDSTYVFPSETLLFRERNNFDYIILITTDEGNKQEKNFNVHQMLILFEIIAKNLIPKKGTGLFPNIFISIIDFNRWDININMNKNQGTRLQLNQLKTLPHPSQSSPNLLSQHNDLIVGIHNQSNSCYINSIIQSLLGTTELIDSLLKMGSSNVIFHPSRANMISTSFNKVLRHMVDSSNKTKTPVSIEEFKMVCGNKCSHFRGNEQEDCAEFCQFLIDSLNEELKVTTNNNSSPIPNNRLPPADQNWLQYLSQNNSVITKLFVGQLNSVLHCQNCGTSSTTYETFSMLSLPTPRVASCNIMECLRQFFRPHNLGPSNQWNCTRCKRPTPSTQQLVLSKKPKVMIIQLKRFDNCLNKNNCFVQYPIILDQKYTAIQSLTQDNSTYELYSVVCHKGSINNGHYTTYVNKGPNKGWIYFDDTVYRPVRIPTEFITPDAYLLFYRLIKAEW